VSRRPLLRVFCLAGCRLVKIYAGPGGAWVVAETRHGLRPVPLAALLDDTVTVHQTSRLTITDAMPTLCRPTRPASRRPPVTRRRGRLAGQRPAARQASARSNAASPSTGGITTAQLAGTAGRYVSRKPLDVEAAVAELREIAAGRGDLLAERAGLTLGFYARENRDEWSRKALQAALLIAAGADLTKLSGWIVEGQDRAERIR
jgi:hypothetical protein